MPKWQKMLQWKNKDTSTIKKHAHEMKAQEKVAEREKQTKMEEDKKVAEREKQTKIKKIKK